MITTIIFDLAEVYLKGLLGVEHYLEPILKIKDREIYKRLREKELVDLFCGKISEEEYWTKIIKKNNWKVDLELLKKAIRDNFKEIRGMRKIIEKLKEKGFKLGLLSVHAREWIDHCNKKFDYHKLFHSVLYSFEVSMLKSNKKMYKLILQKLNSKPEECVFIDDIYEHLIPAKEIGIATIHFENSQQLKKELASFGIII